MHIDYVSNGFGAQSMYLLYLASQKIIPSTISLTGDTGWETDCDLWTGEKISARDFFDNFVYPLSRKWGIDAYFVRTVDKYQNPLPSIPDYLRERRGKARFGSQPVPLFGSNGGRLAQNCTDKWKVAAMHQQLRRLGADTARSAQGIHYGEASRRVKGLYIGEENGFSIYKKVIKDKKAGKTRTIKWLSHYYPLVDKRMNRQDVRAEMVRLKLPFLDSSECDGCPHCDIWRWSRRTPETIEMVADLESGYEGEFFFTDRRIPLKQALLKMKQEESLKGRLFGDYADFGCDKPECGV